MQSKVRELTTVILLDIDGVLVADRGYRAAVVATVNYFSGLLGMHGMAPTEDEIDALHASGFTNEWDLNPFAVGILRLARAGGEPVKRPDYVSWAKRTEIYGGRPSERALATLLAELSRHPLPDFQQAKLRSDLEALLADPYDVRRCPTTQVQQEFALGSELYSAHYGLPPRFSSPSLLQQEDRPALTAEGRACLERLVTEQGAKVCIYTARPSGPPAPSVPARSDRGNPSTLVSPESLPLAPEAELAVQMVELEQYPLVAMGRMQWLADRHGETVEALTKPSPAQLLASLGAALSGEEEPALESAYDLFRHGELCRPLDTLIDTLLDLYVLEDAVPGLHAATEGLRLLEAQGITSRLQGIGVTRSMVKADALAPYCRTVVPDVNAGLRWIEDRLGNVTVCT